MADFSKFKIGNTSYNVKDAAAGKSLSISGTDLSLKNAAGTVISTVTLPSGGGSFVWFTGMSSNNSMSIQMVVDNTGATVSTFQAMRMAANTGAYVFLVDGAFDASGSIYTLTSIEKVQGAQPIEYTITFSGKDGKWIGQCLDTANLTSLTLSFIASGGSSANTNIVFIAQTSGWPTLNTIYSLPGTYKLTNQIGIKATGYGQQGQYETSILASAILIDDTYGSVEDYLASSPSQGASLKIVAWFIANTNTIAKVTANGTYDGNDRYTVSSASATSATTVGV